MLLFPTKANDCNLTANLKFTRWNTDVNDHPASIEMQYDPLINSVDFTNFFVESIIKICINSNFSGY